MLVAIEGIDGSGKGTQATELVKRLISHNIPASLFSFPCYDETFFGKEVGKYLNGFYGQLDEVPVEFASLLYAGDRFEKKEELKTCLNRGEVVVCDRYVASNMAHQGAKVSPLKRPDLLKWITSVEYGVYGLPKPDCTFLLDVPLEVSRTFVLKKKARSYTEKKMDLHESAAEYLGQVYDVYQQLALDNKWERITCFKEGKMLSIGDVAAKIYASVTRQLSSHSV